MASYTPFLSHSVNIFDRPEKQIGFKDGFDHIIRPNTLQNNSIEFRLEPDQLHYLKPDQTLIYCKFKVQKRGGGQLAGTENVAPVNFFPAALFSSCEVYCNDVRVTGASANSLPYKRYLETVSSYGVDARESHLQLSLFHMDTPGNFEPTDANTGFGTRKDWIKASKSCEFIYWLQLDILNTDKLYPNGMKLKFVFERNVPEWCLLEKAPDPPTPPAAGQTAKPTPPPINYEIVIEEMHMQMRKIALADNLLLDHEREFARQRSAIYPYTNSILKKFTIQKGQTTEYLPAVITGKLPTQILLVMNETAADLGDIRKNPFHFQHFNLTRAGLSVDGQLKKEYRCDFANDQFDELLAAYYQNVSIHNSNSGVLINKEYFKGGATILSWNLSGDKSTYMVTKNGTVDIDLEFGQALTCGVTVLVLALFDDVLSIDP